MTTTGRKRGFGSMDPAKQREIAGRGGRAAHAKGTAHKFTAEEAAAAGRKGGAAVSRDRERMAEIGRKGGQDRGKGAKARANGFGSAKEADDLAVELEADELIERERPISARGGES